MHYLGGKHRIGKKIINFLSPWIIEKNLYVEPFCGACNTIAYASLVIPNGNIIAYDIHKPLISMWKSLQEGWIPPEHVTEEKYNEAKNYSNDDPEKAFIGFGCSFGGKYFGGMARCTRGRNYARDAKNSLLKKLKKIKKSNVHFYQADAFDILSITRGAVIYCDPPYENTTKFNKTPALNYPLFWDKVREASAHNMVFVSSYHAPEDFTCVLEIPTKTDMRNKEKVQETRIEKLFSINSLT